VGRGRAGFSAVLRVALVVSAPVVLLVMTLAVVAGGGRADAAPTQLSFAPAHVPIRFTAVGPSGAQTSVSVLVVDSSLLPPGDLAPEPLPTLPAGEAYFHIWLQSQDPADGGTLVPLNFPAAAASLVTSAGTVAATGMDPGPGDLDAQLYFPVADSITKATLVIGATTVTATGADGSAISYDLDPATIEFVTTAPATAPVPTGGSAGSTGPVSVGSPVALSSGTSSSLGIGLGLGALVVLGAGVAGLLSLRRRRAFSRADREKRITISSAPVLGAGTTLPTGAVLRDRPAILVKILGALQIDGARRKSISVPVLEIIVFLALNPGQTFNSAQLRERIWGLGRKPITSGTFRNYMTELRKVLGPGMVVTERYNFTMTGAVSCDRDQFRALLEGDDVLAGQEEALALVRGPVLHGAFEGKNSPFTWALDAVHLIEDEVTSVAVDLALACLAQNDPARASRAVAQGLLCMESDLRLRTVDLEVGAAVGGPGETGRRLQAAKASMATFPHDVAELERTARRLGWAAPVSG
jgi:DNA-binding SARP family transcriptional activator